MKKKFGTVVGCALLAAVALPWAAQAAEPSIVGSYVLVKRVLAGGKAMTPPAVAGMMTFTKEYRNFNVSWTNPDGTPSSLSILAKYTLSGKEYCQTPLTWVMNNIGKPGLVTQAPKEAAGCVAIKVENGKITIPFGGEPPIAHFDRNGMTAEAKGIFTDHWTKIH